MQTLCAKILSIFSLMIGGVFLPNVYSQMDTLKLIESTVPTTIRDFSKVLGWEKDKIPVAPQGFEVTRFAEGFSNPKWIYVAPNGDIFISDVGTAASESNAMDEKSRNLGNDDRIILFRDTEGDGSYKSRYVYMTDLNQPFGMAVVNNYFYVANTDALKRYSYNPVDTAILNDGEKLVDLPDGDYNDRWGCNIIVNPERTKIYISVGSADKNAEYNVGEEKRRANILEVDLDGKNEIIYAHGFRNPVGMAWEPVTGNLWTVVSELAELGDEFVTDYAIPVQKGRFYGWPNAYSDSIRESGVQGVRSHTNSVGLVFYTKDQFPPKYHNGMLIGQHGSWNGSEVLGYKVVFVPFTNGKPVGPAEDFLTGFIANPDKREVYGRPGGLAVLPDGSLLVSDDAARIIWRITANNRNNN